MLALFYVDGDYAKVGGGTERFRGIVATPNAVTIPDVGKAVGGGKVIVAIRNVKLLVELEKDKLDFMVEQMG